MQTCPVCNAPVPPGTRWCPICHVNVLNPQAGKLASPGKRFGAYVFDTLIPFFVVWTALCGGGGLAMFSSSQKEDLTGAVTGAVVYGMLLILLGLGYAIWALLLFVQGTTPGKYLLGMYVVKEDGSRAGFWTMLFREWIGKFVSGLFLGIGYLWVFLNKDRQGWHDMVASTYVVEKVTS